MHLSGLVGLHRQVESIISNRTPQFPERYPNEMFATHIVGAMAEFSVAKYLEIEWEAHVNHFSLPDLVAWKSTKRIWIEVRYTPRRNDIKVKDSDPDHAIVIGVTGDPPNFEIMGFVKAGTVKQTAELQSPAPGKPAWFTEQYKPIEELKQWLSV